MNTLTVGSIISKGFEIGIKNIGTVAGAGVLWILTFWIPYLNVGTTIGLLGNDGGASGELCDHSLIVPVTDSAHIQEAHQVMIHLICEALEES